MSAEELVRYLIEHGRKWVQSQRDEHRPQGVPLLPAERAALEAYFPASSLDSTRFRWIETLENPEFLEVFEAIGQPAPLDFREMMGITFIDTVLLSRARVDSSTQIGVLHFHELVHVTQYSLLGLDRFVQRYVVGLAKNGFEYRAIPLEDDAYTLQQRFERGDAFSVEREVAGRVQARTDT